MMKNEDALKILEYWQTEMTERRYAYPQVVIDANGIAILAVEKQIPAKPEMLKYKPLTDAGWIYKCPNCGCACGINKYHEDVTADDKYCTQCGQALDWEGMEQ